MRVLMIAPFLRSNLGAANKIDAVMQMLLALQCDVKFVNSCARVNGVAGVPVRSGIDEIPLSKFLGWMDKLVSPFRVRRALERAHRGWRPEVIWIYNTYYFEVFAALSVVAAYEKPRIVLEWEDSALERGRGLNPKPYMDHIAWLLLRRRVNAAVAVNQRLCSTIRELGCPAEVFAGFVDDSILLRADARTPFSAQHKVATVGYFGGLNREKGAAIVLEAISRLADVANFIVCGSGQLWGEFEELSRRCRNLVLLRGLEKDALASAIAQCDVLLNPHRPIDAGSGGIFPFKVVEALASRRLLITTDLPDLPGVDLRSAAHFVPSTAADFIAAIADSRQIYFRNRAAIDDVAGRVRDRYGFAGATGIVQRALGCVPH